MGVIPARDPGPGKPKPVSGELDTTKLKPWKGKTEKQSLVPLVGRHHRSVLGVVTKRSKDRYSSTHT
jgi:hypothetical protein